MAGLPGTGLGGIFYALLVLVVVGREVFLTLQNRSSPARWRMTFRVFAMLTLMAGVFWAEAYLLKQLIDNFNAISVFSSALRLPEAIVPALAWTPFLLLAVVMGFVQLLRLGVQQRRRKMAP